MTKLLTILLIGLIFEAIGVVCLNRGVKQIRAQATLMDKIGISEGLQLAKLGVTNHQVLLGILFEAIFFGTLMTLMSMSKGAVSFIWPLTSMGFVLTTIAAKFFLHEDVSLLRWGGVLLIMMGAGLITYSEKVSETKTAPPPSQVSTAQ